jgi:ABC-type antimicrobial peptide transport system permease subunit
LRSALAELDPDEPLEPVGTLSSLMREQRKIFHAVVAMAGGVGLAGLLMAITGLYAVVAFTVTRRTREVGVRMALGASPRRVVWTMLREGAVQLGQGLLLGLALTLMMAPVVQALTGAQQRSYGVHLAVGAVLLIAGLTATAVPALRAVRIQPTAALRVE